jgi:DNA-binding NtrC family response regulator
MNLLVVGGDPERRRGIAFSFHRNSPLHLGPFVPVQCEREEEPIALGLRAWAAGTAPDFGWNPLDAARCGTLFLDSVGKLTASTQRLLLDFARHLSGAGAGQEAWPLRLAAGHPEDLSPAVAMGAFSAALYDCLDKIRIEVTPAARGAA